MKHWISESNFDDLCIKLILTAKGTKKLCIVYIFIDLF